MKYLTILLFLFTTTLCFCQEKTQVDTAKKEEIKLPRYYNNQCMCPMIFEPGKKVPEWHPNAKWINDEDLWEWVEGPFGEKIYDVKAEYTDTLRRNDGSFIMVGKWHKDPNWVKPAKTNL